jgi:hypothetical protein
VRCVSEGGYQALFVVGSLVRVLWWTSTVLPAVATLSPGELVCLFVVSRIYPRCTMVVLIQSTAFFIRGCEVAFTGIIKQTIKPCWLTTCWCVCTKVSLAVLSQGSQYGACSTTKK